MRVPFSWLREYVLTKLSPEALAERLTMAGIEVERVIDRRKDFDNVVIGEVVKVDPHPNADKLRLAYVVTKPDQPPHEIVCGAPNIAKGQKVAVALLGATLPNGLTIEPRKIRGIASQGMVCAEEELGLGTSHTGIMVLDSSLAAGTPFAEAMGFNDAVLDMAIPANRGDLLSVRGVAFEAAALLGARFKSSGPRRARVRSVPSKLRVKIAAPKLCARYTARTIRGVKLQPSPSWLASRLRLAGIRPINAIVDATNYVMLEYGQPLHAFDASTVSGGTITIRTAAAGEHMTTLDGVKRNLDQAMLVIADRRGPIALAGVMGGAESEVSAHTTDVILESAVFNPVSVRKTSRALGLPSEASHRFEKGLPLQLADQASAAAAQLMTELCGGTVDQIVAAGKKAAVPTVIGIASSMFSRLLGVPVPPAAAKQALTRLGCTVSGSAAHWRITVPFWRLDLCIAEDVVEEVGRVLGYADLPDALPAMAVVPQPLPELMQLIDDMRDLLVSFGFTETISHAFYGESWKKQVGGEHFTIANPLDKTQQYLRRSIVPQLQDTIRRGVNVGRDARVFEIGRVFPFSDSKSVPPQPRKLAIGMAFKAPAGYVHGGKLRGVVDELLAALSASLDGVKIHVDPSGFRGRIMEWCELDVAEVRDRRQPRRFKPLPLRPAAFRDVSLWIPEQVQYRDVERAITTAAVPLLERVEPFDVFEKENRRSLALHLTFRASDRTLTDEEILAKMKAIENALKRLGAEIR